MRHAVLLLALAAVAGADERDPIGRMGGVAVRDAAGRITAVDLRSSWVTDSDLAYLASLPALEKLDLSLTRITDHGMRLLRTAPGIVDLNLYYAEQITDEGMAAVKNWKRLKRVNLRGTKITDTTLEHLSGIETLEAIDAGFAQVTDVGIDRLISLPNLRELMLGGNKLTDMGLESLRQMPGLTHLDLSGQQRTDSGLWSVSLTEIGVGVIAGLKEMRELRLGGTAVSARSFEKLKALERLERIGLQGCRRVGDDALAVLATYPALKVLDVKGTAVTEKGLALLKQAKPGLTILSGAWDLPRMPARGQ
jgi:internalin A